MKKLILAIRFAVNGLRYALRYENNFRIELCIAVMVTCAGIIFKISHTEWLICIINIGIVLSAEIFNTSVEKLCDLVSTEINPLIKIIKDTSAAAVLVSAIAASLCGAFIFIPHINQLIRS